MANRATSLLALAWLALQRFELAAADCCYGRDDACDVTSQSACNKMTRRKGCEWRTGTDADCTLPPGCCYGEATVCWDADYSYCTGRKGSKYDCVWLEGTTDNPPDCTPPTPEPGCCFGSNDACQSAEDESTCSSRQNQKKGCEWRSGSEADCTPVPGCCYGEADECWNAEASWCSGKQGTRKGCEWREGTVDELPDCTPPTEEPGCCYGTHSLCESADTASDCTSRQATRAGCEWRSGLDADCSAPTQQPTTQPTDAPTEKCGHRHRKSWAEISQSERELFIDGFLELADQGITQQFTQAHLDSSMHSNSAFLPWHREFVYRMENAIRGLGGKYECFAMPYWDWTDEPTPSDVLANPQYQPLFLTSGLGGDSKGQCMNDSQWGPENYQPVGGSCLVRDVDYTNNPIGCTFWNPAFLMGVVDASTNYDIFRPYLEGAPHATPHVCIGGKAYAHMATYYSPDDPLFYLHHTFIDYVWALWQDCSGYEGVEVTSYSPMYDNNVRFMLSFSPLSDVQTEVSATFDLANYDVSYEKGGFWENALVAELNGQMAICHDGWDNTHTAWFYNEDELLSAHAGKGNRRNADPKNPGRRSRSMAQQMAQSLMDNYPDMPPTDLIDELGFEVCMFEQMTSATGVWEVPSPGLPDCTQFPMEEGTGDRDISLEQMLDPSFGLGAQQIELRERMYGWAQIMHQKEALCAGCYDQYCDFRVLESANCQFNGNLDDDVLTWDERVEGVMTLMGEFGEKVHANMNMVVMVSAVLALLMARKCMERDERAKSAFIEKSVREMSYGAV